MSRFLLVLGVLVGLCAVMMGAPSASAGSAKHAPAGTIALATANPKLGQYANFTYNVVNVKSPRIQVVCSQDTLGVVYAEAQPAGQAFLLGGSGSVWKTVGGPANCVATLYYWDFTPNQVFIPLASVTFPAAG